MGLVLALIIIGIILLIIGVAVKAAMFLIWIGIILAIIGIILWIVRRGRSRV